MDIAVTQEQGRVPVTVLHKGSVDASSYQQLQRSAQEAIAGGSRNLLLNLGRVSYMSSAGLRAINYIHSLLDTDSESDGVIKELRTGKFKSPHLKLFNPSLRVLPVLQMTGYDMFPEIHRNMKDAVGSFGPQSIVIASGKSERRSLAR